ncbi:MAG: ShlB/FhaC/HecB family hemolysin secretion/activation protein [Methylobacter tundripaludum]|nr:ShlB/FhaC/HecB family hemolysin secretion/activation protein [Methylobacter tundripaludum]
MNKKIHWFTARSIGSTLIAAGLYLIPQAFCLAAAPQEFRFNIEHFSVEGLSPLSQTFIDDYFKPLQNKPYTLKELQDVSKALEQVIREQGYPFYRVVVPPQTLASGDVKLQVISFTLGEIEVTGNEYFTRNNVIASLPVLSNTESPNTQALSEALKVANKHPSKQVQVIFKPSQMPDKLNANIAVSERRPYQASLIANNYGTPSSGAYRLTGALQYSNLWGLDHIVNGSYSTSPDHADSVKQYGFSYSLPVYRLKGWLSAYYASSSVNVGTVATDLTVTGAGEMYGIHYQQFLPKLGKYEHSLDLGIDNRYFINDVQFQSSQIGANVRSVPFSVLYKGEYPWQNAHTGYYVQWVGNTDFGGHNTDAHYQASRLNTKQNWDLLRYGGSFSVNVENWLIQTSLTGQQSNNPLIAGEQLGIGGSFDVRGYEQRETGADSGEIVKFEVTTPAWPALSLVEGQKTNLFAFYDYGHGRLQSATPGQVKDWNLSGTGIGARFQWQEYFLGNIAFANALDTAEAGTTKAGDNRIHANIVFKY